MSSALTWLKVAVCFGAVAARGVELDIPVFVGGYGIEFYEQTARRFEEMRPGVKVKLYGDPRIHDRVRVRIIDGNFPDAACVPYVLWPALMKAGRLVDLTPFLEGRNWEGDKRWGDTFLPGALDSWRMEGRVYGLPFTYACWTLFYNRVMFREHGWAEPRTWDEFLGLCDRMRAAGVTPLSIPGTRWLYPDAILRSAYYDLAGAEGWSAVNDQAPGARLDPRFVRSAALLQKIMAEDAQRGWEGETAPGAERVFLQGRAAMTISGSWFFNEMKGKIPAGFEVGAMNFPVFTDGAADPTTIQTGSDCFFVFATGNAERERLTIDFLRFLTSRGRAEAFVRLADAPVAVRGVPAAAFSARLQDTAAMIGRARGAFNFPQQMLQPPAIRQALVDETSRLMEGRISPRQFAARLEAADSADRAGRGDPGHVDYRHPVAGFGLLAMLGGGVAWLLSGWARERLGATFGRMRGPNGAGEGYFGPLRRPVALGFVGPALVLYGTLAFGPALAAFGWAFIRWDGIGPRTWAGLYNFKALLFESDSFWMALGNNVYLMAVPALAVVPLALLFAALIQRGVWGTRAFRAVVLFPNMLGGIAATLLWLNAYEPHGGLVNAGLTGLGRALHISRLGAFADFPWLSNEHLYTAIVPIYLWMACGFNLILYLAAMESIDPQLYEAAEMDGASSWRQFFSITLPLMREVIGISAVFLVIGGLNAFEMIWLLTSQEPTADVQTLGTLLVTTMFKNFEIGRAAALAVILCALVFVSSAAVLRAFKSETVEN